MKKVFVAIVFFTFFVSARPQTSIRPGFEKGFSISGTFKGFQSGNVVLTYLNGDKANQFTGAVKGGKFQFTGQFPEAQQVTLSFNSSNYNSSISFFAANENITVSLDTTFNSQQIIEGSASQKEYEKYQELVAPVEKKSEELNRTGTQLYVSGKLTEPLKDSLFKVHDDYDKEKRSLIARFAKKYPASAVSAWAISVFYGYDPQLDELEAAYNFLSANNKTSLYGKQVKEIIESAKKTAIGKQAIDFAQPDINGNTVSLSSYKGKYVLVDFWASWCGPCRAENPNLVRLYSKYHSDKFDILGISLDNNKAPWQKAISSDKLTWTQVSDLKSWESKVVQAYGIKGIPFNMLLDKDGKIIAKNLRGAALQKKLEEIFN